MIKLNKGTGFKNIVVNVQFKKARVNLFNKLYCVLIDYLITQFQQNRNLFDFQLKHFRFVPVGP